MAAPWEKYAAPAPAPKPWEKYAQPGVAAMGSPNGPTAAAEDKDWTDAKIPGTEISARNVGQGVANVLPTVGSIAGGVGAGAAATPESLGTATIPAGIGGAMAGGAAGNVIKKSLERYFDKKNPAGYKASLYDQIVPQDLGAALEGVKQGAIDTGEGAAQGMANEVGGQVVSKVAGKVLPAAVPWMAQQFTGVPADTVKAYMENGPAALAQYEVAGKNLGDMADRIRSAMADSIGRFRGEQNDTISKTLGDATDRGEIQNIGGPIRNMETGMHNINPEAYPTESAVLAKALKQSKALIPKDPLTKEAYAYGATPVERLPPEAKTLELPLQRSVGEVNPVKYVPPNIETHEFPEPGFNFNGDYAGQSKLDMAPTVIRNPGGFQRSAPTTENIVPQSTGPIQYREPGGFQKAGPWAPEDHFEVTPTTAYEAKRLLQDHASGSYAPEGTIFNPTGKGAATIKDSAAKLRQQIHEAYPDVAAADTKLSDLHTLDEQMKASLHMPGQATGALSAAGAGTNPMARKQLTDLGNLVGDNFVTPAQNLSVAQQFGKTNLLPVDATGKAVLRTGALSKAGGFALQPFGQGASNFGATLGAAASSPLMAKKAIDIGQSALTPRLATAGAQSAYNRILNAIYKEKKNGQSTQNP